MKVWIDQDLCTGDGLCEEICPDVFFIHSDGLAYVRQPGENPLDDSGEPLHNHTASDLGIVAVRTEFEERVQEASEECPGECIFIEHN